MTREFIRQLLILPPATLADGLSLQLARLPVTHCLTTWEIRVSTYSFCGLLKTHLFTLYWSIQRIRCYTTTRMRHINLLLTYLLIGLHDTLQYYCSFNIAVLTHVPAASQTDQYNLHYLLYIIYCTLFIYNEIRRQSTHIKRRKPKSVQKECTK